MKTLTLCLSLLSVGAAYAGQISSGGTLALFWANPFFTEVLKGEITSSELIKFDDSQYILKTTKFVPEFHKSMLTGWTLQDDCYLAETSPVNEAVIQQIPCEQ